MKTISVVESLSCMVFNVKGCLGRQKHWGVELYMLEQGIWHGQNGKGVPRCLLMEGNPPIRCKIVGGKQNLDGQ